MKKGKFNIFWLNNDFKTVIFKGRNSGYLREMFIKSPGTNIENTLEINLRNEKGDEMLIYSIKIPYCIKPDTINIGFDFRLTIPPGFEVTAHLEHNCVNDIELTVLTGRV